MRSNRASGLARDRARLVIAACRRVLTDRDAADRELLTAAADALRGAKEAKVEDLTAQVRVLMVDSTQVTLSMAKQLDVVDPQKIEPFGRVRTDKDPTGQVIEVVGSANDGGLARAATSRTRHRCPRNERHREDPCDGYRRLYEAMIEAANSRPGGRQRRLRWPRGRVTVVKGRPGYRCCTFLLHLCLAA